MAQLLRRNRRCCCCWCCCCCCCSSGPNWENNIYRTRSTNFTFQAKVDYCGERCETCRYFSYHNLFRNLEKILRLHPSDQFTIIQIDLLLKIVTVEISSMHRIANRHVPGYQKALYLQGSTHLHWLFFQLTKSWRWWRCNCCVNGHHEGRCNGSKRWGVCCKINHIYILEQDTR